MSRYKKVHFPQQQKGTLSTATKRYNFHSQKKVRFPQPKKYTFHSNKKVPIHAIFIILQHLHTGVKRFCIIHVSSWQWQQYMSSRYKSHVKQIIFIPLCSHRRMKDEEECDVGSEDPADDHTDHSRPLQAA